MLSNISTEVWALIVAIISPICYAIWKLFKISHENDLLELRIKLLEAHLEKIEEKLDQVLYDIRCQHKN